MTEYIQLTAWSTMQKKNLNYRERIKLLKYPDDSNVYLLSTYWPVLITQLKTQSVKARWMGTEKVWTFPFNKLTSFLASVSSKRLHEVVTVTVEVFGMPQGEIDGIEVTRSGKFNAALSELFNFPSRIERTFTAYMYPGCQFVGMGLNLNLLNSISTPHQINFYCWEDDNAILSSVDRSYQGMLRIKNYSEDSASHQHAVTRLADGIDLSVERILTTPVVSQALPRGDIVRRVR